MLDNGPAQLIARPGALRHGARPGRRDRARSCSPPPTAIGCGPATSPSIFASAGWRAAARSRAGCRSAASPPASSRSTCPSAASCSAAARACISSRGASDEAGCRFSALPPCCSVLAVGQAALGQSGAGSALKGHDTDAPVDVAADRIEVQDRADRAIFSGNVEVRQGNLQLSAGAPHRRLCQCRRHRDRAARGERRRHPAQPVRNRAQPVRHLRPRTGGW